MLDTDSLERKLNLARRELGLIGGRVKVTPLQKKGSRLEAAISLRHFNIDFKIDPRIDELWGGLEPLRAYAAEAGITDLVGTVCTTIINHEVWHWKKDEISGKIGCPTDWPHAAEILDSIHDALTDKRAYKGMDERAQKALATEFRHIFEDILVNANLAYEKAADGIVAVYFDAGLEKQSYQPFAEGFFQLQMELWGQPHEKQLLQHFYTQDAGVERKIESVVKDTLKGMGLYQQPLERVIERFRDPEEWNGLAYKMAWHLADLLKQPPGDGKKQGQQGGQGGDGNQQQKGGGIGDMLRKLLGKKPKDEQKQQDAGSGKPDGQEPPQNPQGPQDAGQEPNEDDGPQPLAPGIAQSLDDQFTPEAERQVVMHYYGKNAGPPACMPLPRVLKLAYEQFANAVEIRAKRPGDGFEMPLTPIRHEPFTPAEHDIQDLDFGKAIIDIESPFPGRVNFSVPADHYTVSHPYTLKKERLPDIMFLFDCSGSMNDSDRPGAQKLFQLPAGWTEDSKYHYALLGAFGAIKWLKAARLAPYVKYNATLFSNSTRTTGWRGYNELEKATELFWQPEFGGTSIRMDVLGKELDTDPSVILMISDGGIDNWGSIKTEFKKKTAKHLLSYIQIKDKTETGKDLAAWGRPVYHIDKAEDLDGLIIDLTKQTYKGHAP